MLAHCCGRSPSKEVKELTLMRAWKKDKIEKEKMLEFKSQQLEQFHEFKMNMNVKDNEIEELKMRADQYKSAYYNLQLKVNAFEKDISSLKAKHREDLMIQIRSNRATESTKERLAGKLTSAEFLLRNIHKYISQTISLKPRTKDIEEIALVENEFAFLWDDFETFYHLFLDLQETQKHYKELHQENEWVLTYLGFAPQKQNTPNLVNAFKDFASHSEENVLNLKKDINMKNQLLRDKNTLIKNLLHYKEISKESTQPNKVHSLKTIAMSLIRQQINVSLDDVQENSEKVKESVIRSSRERHWKNYREDKIVNTLSKRKVKPHKIARKSEDKNEANILPGRSRCEIKQETKINEFTEQKLSSLPSIDNAVLSQTNSRYQRQTKGFSLRNSKMSTNMAYNHNLNTRQSSTPLLDGLTTNSIRIFTEKHGKND